MTHLWVFISYFCVVIARGRLGLNQIPSDPGYDYLYFRMLNGFRLFELRPYLHADQPLIASLTTLLPISVHGWSTTFLTHTTWGVSGLVIFTSLRHHGLRSRVSFIAGLLLVFSPWAAQSVIGNYGNVRWPILVASAIAICSEVSSLEPRRFVLVVAALAASLANPLGILLALPMAYGFVFSGAPHRRTYVVSALPLLIGLVLNLAYSQSTGHATKITWFWPNAGLFWTSGQLLPSTLAAIGLAVTLPSLKRWGYLQRLSVNLFLLVLVIALASYMLGGIADRYYVAPAVLATTGVLLLLVDLHSRNISGSRIVMSICAIGLLIPSIRWFAVFPYLRGAPGWSTQVKDAQQKCLADESAVIVFVTSDGQSQTDPVPCSRL